MSGGSFLTPSGSSPNLYSPHLEALLQASSVLVAAFSKSQKPTDSEKVSNYDLVLTILISDFS